MATKNKAKRKTGDRLRAAVQAEIAGRIERLETQEHEQPSPKEVANNEEVTRYAAAEPAEQTEGGTPPGAPTDGAQDQETEEMRTKKHDKKDASQPKAKRERKAKAPKEPKVKKVSALDAAAQVLSKAKEPMRSKDLIEAMASKGLWTSPGGKTPDATLYAAMMREINTKGEESRFKRTERGLFAAGPALA